MSILLLFHLLALGVWIGVVGAEFAIEFDGMKDDQSLIKASKLHYLTDVWVEIPAFLIVLLTGLLMLDAEHFQGLFLIKIMFALLAIFFNGVCVYAVFKRRRFALANDLDGVKSVTPIMRLGAAVIPTFLISFALAMFFLFAGAY